MAAQDETDRRLTDNKSTGYLTAHSLDEEIRPRTIRTTGLWAGAVRRPQEDKGLSWTSGKEKRPF